MFRKLIGDKAFYRRVLWITIPILLQNFITNFVSMLDNVMIGQVSDAEMSGVSVSNQLFFVFNLCIFGAISGAGIFGAQFHGNGNTEGVRDTFRFKLIFTTLLTLLGVAVYLTFGQSLIAYYLFDAKDPIRSAASQGFAWEYMQIMLIGLLPYVVSQCFASTLRETGKTVFPMVAGIIAVLVNLVLNYLLIFDHFGRPGLGVAGAAIATVVSRFVELAVLVFGILRNISKHPFIRGAFQSLLIPRSLVMRILRKGIPLMLNETGFALGLAIVNACYSSRGLDVVAANTINQTFFNVFSVAFMAVGVSVGIVVGQLLGAEKFEEAKSSAVKLIALSIFVSLIVAFLFALLAAFIPGFYKTSDEVRLLATRMMLISAAVMPLDAFAHASYFTLRSGGKTLITILFDSGYTLVFLAPLALALSRLTDLSILPLMALCQSTHLLKCVLGYYFIKRGDWLVNIVTDREPSVE